MKCGLTWWMKVNTKIPSYEGMHDITFCDLPPNRKPLLVNRVDDKIGSLTLPIDHEKIIGIIESQMPDNTTPNDPEDEISQKISEHIIDFFQAEVKAGRLPASLLPLQSGIGNIANAIVGGLANGYEPLFLFLILESKFIFISFVFSPLLVCHLSNWFSADLSRTWQCGPRWCKTHSSISSTKRSWPLPQPHPFDSLLQDSRDSTRAGTDTRTRSSFVPNKSPMPLSSFADWVLLPWTPLWSLTSTVMLTPLVSKDPSMFSLPFFPISNANSSV